MTFKHLFMTLTLSVLMVACGNGKLHVSEVAFSDSRAYVDGQSYSGEIWSNDGRSYCLTTQDGVITGYRLFHSNDSTAIAISNDSTVACYGEDGQELPLDTFKLRYEGLYESLSDLVTTIKGGNE